MPVVLVMPGEECHRHELARLEPAERYLADSRRPMEIAALLKLRRYYAQPGLLSPNLLSPDPAAHSVKYAHPCTLREEAFAHEEQVIHFTSCLGMSALLPEMWPDDAGLLQQLLEGI